MRKLIASCYDPNEITVVTGDFKQAAALTALPFNHIFFTGSPAVGRIVMSVASGNLTSVSLELGGKSPAIVADSSNIPVAAKRIMWGKTQNAGQICVAPDSLYIHEDAAEGFISESIKQLDSMYNLSNFRKDYYTRIVNARHFNRIKNLFDDAVKKGSRVCLAPRFNESELFISPGIICDIPENAVINEEEIFGPILPVYTFNSRDEVYKRLKTQPVPLALYAFSRNREVLKEIARNTRSGDMMTNGVLLHVITPKLPFGGLGNSGIGKAHGYNGFLAFSHIRSRVDLTGCTPTDLLMPPYRDHVKKFIKYFATH